MTKNQHRHDERQKDSSPPEVKTAIKAYIYRRFGWWGLLIMALAGLIFAVWWNWNDLRSRPFVSQIADRLFQAPVPQADPQLFSILVAELDNDNHNEIQRLILEGLYEFKSIEVLALERKVKYSGKDPKAEEEQGHAHARQYLKQSGADVVLWGTVIRMGQKAVPKLFWTTTEDQSMNLAMTFGMPGWTAPGTGRYLPTPSLALPRLFVNDLIDALSLMVLGQARVLSASHPPGQSSTVAEEISKLLDKTRPLLEEGKDQTKWSHYRTAKMISAFVNALDAYRFYSQDDAVTQEIYAWLTKAASEYESALRDTSRTSLQWADIQTQLGNVLLRLGNEETRVKGVDFGTALRSAQEKHTDATTAFRSAMEVYNKKSTPMQWAACQLGLGAALLQNSLFAGMPVAQSPTLDKEASLKESISAYRNSLEVVKPEEAPFLYINANIGLGFGLLFEGLKSRDRDLRCEGFGFIVEGAALMVKKVPFSREQWRDLFKENMWAECIDKHLEKVEAILDDVN